MIKVNENSRIQEGAFHVCALGEQNAEHRHLIKYKPSTETVNRHTSKLPEASVKV